MSLSRDVTAKILWICSRNPNMGTVLEQLATDGRFCQLLRLSFSATLGHSTKGELKRTGLLVLTLWSTKVVKVSLGSQSDARELEIGGLV